MSISGILGDSRISVKYINIDSSHKKDKNSIKQIIKLDANPLAFDGSDLKIFVDTTYFNINDSIYLSGLTDFIIKLRSITDNKCFIFNDNKMTINSSINLPSIINMTGFMGDTQTDIIYNTKQYKWNIINNIGTKTIQIFEDVLGSAYLRIIEFTIDLYGTVININNDMLDSKNNIEWAYNNTIQQIPNTYYNNAQAAIANIVCNVPNTIYNVMQYVNTIQNLIRPLFIQYVITINSNCDNLYRLVYKTYSAVVQIITDIKKTTITSSIGNILVNTLNTQHNVTNNSITLDRPYIRKECKINNYLMSNTMCVSIFDDTIYDVTIKYNCIYNVPISYINQTHIIKSIEQKYIVINMDHMSNSYNMFGGNDLYINIIDTDISSKYIIDLECAYTNIIKIKMISSYFYNSYKNITRHNNSFYWQTIDNTLINKIILPIKNYTPHELKTEIETLSNHTINIDINDNTINFNCFNIIENVIFTKKITLSKINKKNLDPFYQYPFGNFFNNNNPIDGICIKIYRPNHNMTINQKIIIKNAINYGTIPSNYLNGEHKIVNVYTDGYDIILYNVNYDVSLDNNIRGGNNITIYEPCLFRILFEYPNTFGDILGHTINTTFEYTINSIFTYKFYPPSYILICCDTLSSTDNLGLIKKYFYKINLFDKHNYDTFVDAPLILNEPIRNINQLKFDIYNPDGTYYNFYDKEYSFVLEFTTYTEIPI